MADVAHDALLKAFEKRYDFQAARTVLDDTLKISGIGAKDAYADADMKKIGEVLSGLGERFSDVVLDALTSDEAPAEAAPKKEEAKKDDKKEAKKDDKKKKKK